MIGSNLIQSVIRRFNNLLDTASATTGAGMVGFLYATAYAGNTVGAWLKGLATTTGATFIGWAQAAGGVLRTIAAKLQENVSVLDYGADATGVTDSSAAFLAAIATGRQVYVPAGTYSVNVVITKPFVLVGDGSQKTIIKPFTNATAALTYNPSPTAPYWTYHSEVHGVGFTNNGTAQTGIGFTFGASTQAAYVVGMEFANNVTFKNCRWAALQKGVNFPFGNIGSEFHSCGWQSNFYGVYCLDNKQYPATAGSALMHGGNKYFFGGEFDANTCGVYVHNVSDGFGGIAFYGTIIESNNVGVYCYTNNALVPVSFYDCWNEGNGALVSGANVTLDSWAGNVVSGQSLAPHAFIFDGAASTYLWRGGFITDVNLIATNSRVLAQEARVEVAPGFAGEPFSVAATTSAIFLTNPETNGGLGQAARVFVKGNFKPRVYDITGGNNVSRVALVPHRYNKLAGAYGGAGTVVNLTAASNLGNGAFNVAAGTTADGVIYGTCNTYSAPFTSTTQNTALVAGTVALTAATWYVVTFDVKVTSGTPTFSSWDRAGNQLFAGLTIPENNVWYSVAALGYSPNAVATFYALDVGCTTAVTAGFNLSAFQIRAFATEHEAQAFIESGVYVGP